MNVSRRRKTQAAGKLRSQIADDVSKQIAGNDDVELSRVADNLHRQSVNVEMPGINVCILLAYLPKNSLPEVVGEGHGVGFVAHADALQAVQPGVFERVTDNALHTFARVHVFLNRYFVRRVFLEESADPHIQALGVLAKHRQTDVFLSSVAQGRQSVVEQLDGARVDIEVQLEAQTQQYVRGMLIRRNPRITECAKENGVKLVA